MTRPVPPRAPDRRRWLLRAAVPLAQGLLLGAGAHVPTAMADTPKVQTLTEALRWLDRLDAAKRAGTTQGWPLPAVLEHMAQSIEMSLDGYPQLKPAWFRASIGPAAFALFDWRGRMRHGLDEPIPGAPALDTRTQDIKPAALRLRNAIARFEKHTGALAPHFAYGALDKAQFGRAHALHIANHQDWIELQGA